MWSLLGTLIMLVRELIDKIKSMGFGGVLYTFIVINIESLW